MQKKGISEVVATVLILLIVILALVIVWQVVLPMVKSGTDINTQKVNLVIDTSEGYTAYDSEKKVACVQIKRGADSLNMTAVDVIFSIGGSSKSFRVPPPELNVVWDLNGAKTYCFNLSEYGKPDSVSIAPVFKDSVGEIVSEVNLPDGQISSGGINFEVDDKGCHANSDSLGIAGVGSLFIDKNNCNCKDSYSKVQARNPSTPWCSFYRLDDDSYLRPRSERLVAGDKLYIKGGDYEITRSVGMFNSQGGVSDQIFIGAYPGEVVNLFVGNGSYFRIQEFSYAKIVGLNIRGYTDSAQGRLYSLSPFYITGSNNTEVINCSFNSNLGPDDYLYLSRYEKSNDSYYSACMNNPGVVDKGTCLGSANTSAIWSIGEGAVVHVSGNNLSLDGVSVSCLNDHEEISCGKYRSDGLSIVVNNSSVRNSKFYDCPHTSFNSNGNNLVIENNFFRNRLHHTSAFSGTNSTIRNNIFTSWGGGKTGAMGCDQEGEAIEILFSSSNVKIYNNIFYNASLGDSGVTQITGSSCASPTKNIEFFNNLIYNVGTYGMGIGSKDYSCSLAVNNTFQNNIVYGVGNLSGRQYLNAEIVLLFYTNFSKDGQSYGNQFRNNIIRKIGSDPREAEVRLSLPGLVYNYTILQFQTLFPLIASENTNADPLFVDAAAGDFHLAAGSPAIDAGICVDYIKTDLDGKPRPTSGCDIGPYEY